MLIDYSVARHLVLRLAMEASIPMTITRGEEGTISPIDSLGKTYYNTCVFVYNMIETRDDVKLYTHTNELSSLNIEPLNRYLLKEKNNEKKNNEKKIMKKKIMKELLSIYESQHTLAITFNEDKDLFAKSIEEVKKEITKSVSKSIVALADGRSNYCNHDFEVFSKSKIGYGYGSSGKEKQLSPTRRKCIGSNRDSVEEFNVGKATSMLHDNINLVGKVISFAETYKHENICFIDGFEILSEKEILQNIVKKSIAIHIREGIAEKELRENSYNLNLARLIRNIGCKQIEMFLSGKFDAETFVELILDKCTI